MNARRLAALALCLAACLLLVRRLRQWAGNPPRRRAAHKEAIERPENVDSYTRFMAVPPMRLLRGYVARAATAHTTPWRVLDVGCGPGWFPLELAERLPDAVVVGVDLSLPMTAKAVTNAAARGRERRACFAQARGEELPFADGSFDLIVSTLALHHWQDPVAVLVELRRVAQPGGRILAFDIRRDIPPWLWTLFKTGQAVSDSLRLCEEGEPSASVAAAFTPAEARRLALQAGWERSHVRAGLGWLLLERPATHAAPYPVPPAARRRP